MEETTIDRTVHLSDAFDASFLTDEDAGATASRAALEPGRDYHAVAARPTVFASLIETDAGMRAVLFDLAIETEGGLVWVPDTMLDPPYPGE